MEKKSSRTPVKSILGVIAIVLVAALITSLTVVVARANTPPRQWRDFDFYWQDDLPIMFVCATQGVTYVSDVVKTHEARPYIEAVLVSGIMDPIIARMNDFNVATIAFSPTLPVSVSDLIPIVFSIKPIGTNREMRAELEDELASKFIDLSLKPNSVITRESAYEVLGPLGITNPDPSRNNEFVTRADLAEILAPLALPDGQ